MTASIVSCARGTLCFLLFAALTPACTPQNQAMPESATASAEQGPLVASLAVEQFPDSIGLALQVTNTSAEPVRLTFPTGQSYDFVVSDGAREIWRWSADRMFTQAFRTETVAPGATLEYEATWTPPAGVRGEITATGILTAQEHRIEQDTQFRLP